MKRSSNRRWERSLFAVCLLGGLLYGIWTTVHLAVAFNESEQVYIFPTQVDTVGWNNENNALTQQLPSEAAFGTFNQQNSSYIEIDTPPDQNEAVGETEQQNPPSQDNTQNQENSPQSGGSSGGSENSGTSTEATSTGATSTTTSETSGSTSTPSSTSTLSEQERGSDEGGTATTTTEQPPADETPPSDAASSTPATTSESTDSDQSVVPDDSASTSAPTDDSTPQAPASSTDDTQDTDQTASTTPPADGTSTTTVSDSAHAAAPAAFIAQRLEELAAFVSEKLTATAYALTASSSDASSTSTAVNTTTPATDLSTSTATDTSTSTDTGTSTDQITTVTGIASSDASTTPDVPTCQVLDDTCHTITFSGFGVSGALDNEQFQGAEINFSFASLAPQNSLGDGQLQVRYYHDGSWHSAGDIYLSNEVSNGTNGGYFSVKLDGINSWDDLSDVQVVIEYVQGQQSPPVSLYLDAVWVAATYSSPVQDVLSGTAGQPLSGAPSNVTQTLAGQNSSASLLVEDDGTTVQFPYLDNLNDDSLILRSDKEDYPSPGPGGSQNVYLSVTNPGTNSDTFNLYASFPGGEGSIDSVEQYVRDVPEATSTFSSQDVTYYCAEGWQPSGDGSDLAATSSDAASSTAAYSCQSTQESNLCSSLSDDGTNCLVANELVATATSTIYESTWAPVPFASSTPSNAAVSGALPAGYQIVAASQNGLPILPGQTLYFEVTMTTPEDTPASFVLSAAGSNYFGDLNSLQLNTPDGLKLENANPDEKKANELATAQFNDQISTATDFSVDQTPTFHFKWKTQTSFLTQLEDLLTGQSTPYTVESATLIHASGEEEDLPVDISYEANDEWTVSLDTQPRDFRPGKYTLEMKIVENGQTYTDSVGFYWGVLALNPNQSVYQPGQTASIAISALDDDGNTICDANLVLTVTKPDGTQDTVPVSPGGGCGQNNVTTLPDYTAQYPVQDEGTYALTLSRLDDTGAVITSSVDSFTVDQAVPFLVQRVGPTRIYPPSAYTMQFNITAEQGFDGTVEEAVPEGFTVADTGGATERDSNGALYLDWGVSMQSGDEKTLSYSFKAPNVSPYMYLLGPMTFTDKSGASVFKETRSWRIAADSLPIATGVALLTGTSTVTSAELNNSSPTALSWNLNADYDNTYYSYSSSSPSQLSIQTAGDYLVSVTLPVTRTTTGTRATRVEADIYVDGSPIDFGVGRSAYISDQSTQKDSSDNYTVLLRNLNVGDYIEVYEYSPDTVNAADSMSIPDKATLYAEYIDTSQDVYFATATTTSSGTNMNPAATSTLNWYDGASSDRSDAGYVHNNATSSSKITLPGSGYYLVDINVPLSGATAADANVRGTVFLDGTLVNGGYFKQGFIADVNGDTSSSIHWSGYVHATSSTDYITVGVTQEAAAETLTVGSNEASIYIQQLPSSGVYASRALNLSGGTNWNVTPAQNILWQNDDVIDTGTYSHSIVSNSDQITVNDSGDYLLEFNDSHQSTGTRPNEEVQVAIGGTAVSGAETRTNLITDLGGNTESSASLVYLLRNLTAGNVITLSSLRTANTGTVTEDQYATLVLWHKAAQNPFIQDTEWWYQNVNAQTPTTPWPGLNQGDAITAGTPVENGNVLRLRIALQANVNTTAGANSFKLQYALGSSCSPALAWTDIGAVGSGSIWRGYNNTSVTPGSTLTTRLLSVSSTSETYEDQNPSAVTPNSLTAGQDGEWDWAIQDNGAAMGASYCFRMVDSSGQALKAYNDYPQLVTDGPPDSPTLDAPFDNADTASTTPWFDFETNDPNAQNVNYEIQISTDPAFGSTVIDEDSGTHFTDFSDIDNPSDRAPFFSGDEVQFTPPSNLTNGTTYYWRVRAIDPSGTDTYGSYSPVQSVTINTSLAASAWFQTQDAQFNNSDTLQNVQTFGSNEVELIPGQTVGTTTSDEIDFDDATVGTAWGTLSWTESTSSGSIAYHVQYLDPVNGWELIPDSALTGNAAGFTSGPVQLSGLDINTYSSIRIEAVLTKGTGTPLLQDWTVSWVLAVNQPSTTAPFDDFEVSTTTPTLSFNAIDPQGDALQYQVEWSTDSTFTTGVSSSTSSTSTPGFVDVASSTASSPFPSGDSINYTIQSGSALTNGTTYWWRVRAKDPGGGNAFSLWSEPQSFTVATSSTVSTWFQTTTAQFAEGTLVRTVDTGDQVSVSSDVGQVAIYRDATAGDAITESVFNHTFDTTVRQDSDFSLTSSSTISLQAGYYAVVYGTRFDRTAGTNRGDVQSDLDLNGTTLPIGWSQAYIRNTGTALMGFASGGGIIDVTTNGELLELQSYRGDVNTGMTVTRTANTDGIQLIHLDSSWPYLRLSKTSVQNGPISTAWMPVTYNREDDINTSAYSFTSGTGNITLLNAGHYLIFANTFGSIDANTRSQVQQKLTLNGADVPGSFSTVYLRGDANAEQTYQGSTAIGILIDATTSNEVLNVEVSRDTGTNPFTIDALPTGTYVNRSAITIVELPAGADYIRMDDTSAANMNPATLTAMPWNTEFEKDSDFTHSTVTNNSRITVNTTGDYFFLADLFSGVAGVARAIYNQGWDVNGGSLIQYGQTGNYNRDTGANDYGNWSGNIFPSLSATSYVQVVDQALATAGTTPTSETGVEGLRIQSLSEADTRAETIESPDIDFTEGTGPKWGTLSWDKTATGSSTVSMQVLYYNSASSTYALVPDSVLPGNSTGTTTSPIQLGGVDHTVYGTLRALATFTCVSGTCPTMQDWTVTWSAGINVSGTIQQFDQATNVASGTVAIAVNGVLQAGKTGTISAGTWTIPNVTAFNGNVITVFVSGASAGQEAVGVTKYETSGDITGMKLYQEHLSLGSNDDPSLSNTDLSQYDHSVSGSADLFDDVTSGNLNVCAATADACSNARLIVLAGTTFEPASAGGASVTTPNLQINGTLIADANTINVSHSWRNLGVFTPGTSSVIFTATSTTESILSTGTSTAFYVVTFGQTSGTATWNLLSPLWASSTVGISFGTLAQGATSTINLGGNLTIGASGVFTKSTATTTFSGSGTSVWTDSSASKQDMGNVLISGSSETVQLGSSVKATNITVASANTLDSVGANTISVGGTWTNNGTFTARTGTVNFTATTTGNTIAPGSSAFFNLTFNGTGGNWAFSTTTISVGGNFTISAGTVTMPSATTTVAGNFDGSGGTFMHNNGTILFTASGAQTIHAGSSSFYNMTFNGTGSWSFLDTNATSSQNVVIQAGTLTMPSGTFAIGGSFTNSGGSFSPNGGTLSFTAATAQTIKFGGVSANNVSLNNSSGSWTFLDTNATTTGSFSVLSGSTTLPTGTFAVGGSFINAGTFNSNNGTVLLNATATGKSVTPGSSKFSNLTFNSSSGGWTITGNATSTQNTTLTAASSFTLASGSTLEVDGTFTNSVGGATTTWAGSTLYLNSGSGYTLNTKSVSGDTYGTLLIGPSTAIRMWNSSAATTTVNSTGSLYSMNHAGVAGALDIWGAYSRSSGSDFWSYATDFDGTALGGSSRQVSVQIASSSSLTFSGGTLNIVGTTTATTSVAVQSSGAYSFAVSGGTLNAQYYSIANAGASGLNISGSTTVSSLANGAFTLSTNGGTMMTVAAATINQNPAIQIQQVSFATTTGISSGFNVTEVGTSTSYWWFRSSYGNYQGEAFDNDPGPNGGNPGYIRWDNSGFNITVAGHVYSDHGVTPIGSPTCNGSTPDVTVVAGTTTFTGSCNSSTGAYSISGVTFVGDVPLLVYLNTNGGAEAVTVTKTATADLANLDLYQNSLIVRHEDISPITITDLASFGSSFDSDIFYSASTSTQTLTVQPGNELYIWTGKTFAPGGNIVLQSGGSGDARDGRLYMATSSTLTEVGTQTLSIGGGLTVGSSATFTPASSTMTFTATTTGKIIQSSSPLTLSSLVFNGSGGGWLLQSGSSATTTAASVTLTAGTLGGTGSLDVQSGNLTGGGTITMTGGTVELDGTGNLGNSNPWQFFNLSLGNGAAATTTETGSATTTIANALTINTGAVLNAGSAPWVLSGGGTPFTINGTFAVSTAPFYYTATSSTTITSATYKALTLAPSASGSPTYTLGGGILSVSNLTVGDGTHGVTVTADTNDPSIDITGTMTIASSSTFVASNVGALDVEGSWNNLGTFTPSGGGVLFDSSATGNTIAAGSSPFYAIQFNNPSGGWTITGNATSTQNTTLTAASSFTLASGSTLEVDGTFTNSVGGATTTWAGSTLYLNSGSGYTLNTKSVSGDTYGTLLIGPSTAVRMWNSSAATTTVNSTGSLYSMNHAGVAGALDIWGAYSRSSGSDFWSYATDFDGTALGGSSRQVSVQIASSSSLTFSGGVLDILGISTATTTVTNQGTGTYSFGVSGGTFDAQYYSIRNTDANGLNFSGTPTISTLSNGDYQLNINGGTMMTVAGSVIDANPLKVSMHDSFATSTGITSGYNVTEVGSPASSWKFNLAYGNYQGEAFNNDPGGNPGYIVWDDSASQISISGHVYSDEGSTVSSVCNGTTTVVRLMVEGAGNYTSACNASTGAYSISGISFNPGDVLTLYLDSNGGPRAADISVDPQSNITGMDLYENRVIVRHESTTPITIADMAEFDSTDDSDIPFTATIGSPNTLTLPPNTKLIVWTGKTFAPAGNITLQSGGSGTSYDGSLEVYAGGVFSGSGTSTYSIGGNFTLDSGATLQSANTTFNFTATTTGKTITPLSSNFYNITFNGVGGNWAFAQANATSTNNFTITHGTVTLPSGVLAVGGSFENTGGTIMHNNGTLLLDSTASGQSIEAGGSLLYAVTFNGTGGAWSFLDTNATSSSDFIVDAGTVTLPSGTLYVGGSFINSGGAFSNSNDTVQLTSSATGKSIEAGGSNFYNLTLNNSSGSWTFLDTNATTTENFSVLNGSTTLPVGTFAVGGSFSNSGTFQGNGGTVLLDATTTGKSVTASSSPFSNLTFNSSSGGWTITGNATSTGNTTITAASSFTLSSGKTLEVDGAFTNSVGGAATTWTGSTLYLNSGSGYTLNTKSVSGDTYGTLLIGPSTAVRMWNSSAATTTVNSTGSLYSMNHAGTSGALDIWGAYTRSSGTDYWSYATDFDGTALGGSSRQVSVAIASSSSLSFSGGTLNIIGGATATTTIANQGSGAYSFSVSGGTFNAQYYSIRNTDTNGLNFSGTPTVSSLGNGDFQLAVNGGTMMTVAGSVIDANASSVFSNDMFGAAGGITSGYNVTRTGSPQSAWTFTLATGSYAGEAFDNDGSDACGNIRWDDSSCLFVNEAHFRWRNDDGGEGALSSTWYNASWSYRKEIVISNADPTTYTNFPVELTVAYDSSMNSNFSDLRFTDSSGTTLIPYFIESETNSATSTVWVQVPSLPASGSATIYMYFGNSGATDASSGSTVFPFYESFESGSLSGYSGDTSLFNVGTGFVHNGSFDLDAGSNSTQKTISGIYKTGSQTAQGDTLRYFQYVDATQQDEPCTLFGVQSSGHNYAVCLEEYPSDFVALAKNVTSDDTSGSVLATSTASYSTGWYQVIVNWFKNGAINVSVYNSAGSLFSSVNATDTTYTSGGYGFTYWDQHGAWDYYTARQYSTSTPTAIFGAKQDDGGATWAAAEDTALSNADGLTIGNIARLRFSVQNTGAPLTGEDFRLQVAPLGSSLNCASVPHANYTDVPVAASCGSSPACMATSSNLTNGQSTAGLLDYPASMGFTAGQVVEDPSNQTGGINVPSDTATEVEYAFKMTSSATGNAYCFRTTNSGSSLDNYAQVAEAVVQHAPTLGTISINDAQDITLTEGTTTMVLATTTVTDENGYADIISASSTIYRSGVGAQCSEDQNSCYQLATSSCTFSNCSGNSCTLSCEAPLEYFADPTDPGSTYSAQNWLATMAVQDSTGLRDTETSLGVDVLTLYGLTINTGTINFGSLTPGANTGSTNATTTIANTGNSPIDIDVSGSGLNSGSNTIPVGAQEYATSTFIYGSCALCQFLTGTTTPIDVNVPKPTSTSSTSTQNVYMGIDVPNGTPSSGAQPYQGTDTFIAASP